MSRLMTAVAAILLVVGAALPASAQEDSGEGDVQQVEGTADHRAPPRLTNGSYTDTIVTGEAVWYAVMYRNDESYWIRVDLEDADLDERDDLNLEASLVAPNLDTVNTARDSGERERWASFGSGSRQWYIRVSLDSDGRQGVKHTFTLDISGFQDSGYEECGEGCDLKDRMESAQEFVAQIEEGGEEAAVAMDDLIADLEQEISDAEGAEAQARSDISDLCGEADTCDELPPASAPLWLWIVSGLLLLGGLGLLAKKKFGS